MQLFWFYLVCVLGGTVIPTSLHHLLKITSIIGARLSEPHRQYMCMCAICFYVWYDLVRLSPMALPIHNNVLASYPSHSQLFNVATLGQACNISLRLAPHNVLHSPSIVVLKPPYNYVSQLLRWLGHLWCTALTKKLDRNSYLQFARQASCPSVLVCAMSYVYSITLCLAS